MTCGLPDLNWARLSEYDDGTANVLTCGGIERHDSVDAAVEMLREDEYALLEDVIEDYEDEYPGVPLAALRPPTASTPGELKPFMRQMWDADLSRWRTWPIAKDER